MEWDGRASDVDVTLPLLGLGLDTAKRGELKPLLDSIMSLRYLFCLGNRYVIKMYHDRGKHIRAYSYPEAILPCEETLMVQERTMTAGHPRQCHQQRLYSVS